MCTFFTPSTYNSCLCHLSALLMITYLNHFFKLHICMPTHACCRQSITLQYVNKLVAPEALSKHWILIPSNFLYLNIFFHSKRLNILWSKFLERTTNTVMLGPKNPREPLLWQEDSDLAKLTFRIAQVMLVQCLAD